MKIFHYHPDTGVLLGEGVADESPLEPGIWLIPAYSATSQPPVPGDGEQVVMVGDSWQLQPVPEPEPEPEAPLPLPTLDPESLQQMTTEQKLNAFGLTVAELKELFGLN